MDSFDKGWFVLQTYSGYENKVKENLLQRAQTYNMLENILRVEIPTQTVQVEKNGKTKEIEENRLKLGLLSGIPRTLLVSLDPTETVQNQLHCWKKKSAVSCSLWVKLFKSLIWMSR